MRPSGPEALFTLQVDDISYQRPKGRLPGDILKYMYSGTQSNHFLKSSSPNYIFPCFGYRTALLQRTSDTLLGYFSKSCSPNCIISNFGYRSIIKQSYNFHVCISLIIYIVIIHKCESILIVSCYVTWYTMAC